MFTIKGVVYPEKITALLTRLQHARESVGGNAVGTEANFACGSFIRFTLFIDIGTSVVTDVAFRSNGCGYMLAAANKLSERVSGRHLRELHGLPTDELRSAVAASLGSIPPEREDCVNACMFALRTAFADFRTMQIDEFRGERALICTCFGVTEETIENTIADHHLRTIDDVAHVCNAGGGCGSCRMLIQEMLDNSEVKSLRFQF